MWANLTQLQIDLVTDAVTAALVCFAAGLMLGLAARLTRG